MQTNTIKSGYGDGESNYHEGSEEADVSLIIEAAIKIQRVWRRYIDLQVSRYYKDLVIFHNEGDPALIMKYINPIEAKLIDSACGIHIKFRLAGHQFPPTIYYKIFTHRPVQDICANAPRDYTRQYLKMQPAHIKHDRNKGIPIESVDGWYQRIENNGWRPVSNKHLHQMNLDYYYGAEKCKPVQTFHHQKCIRKQDVEIRRKQKKIEWMNKMYKTGMLNSKDNDAETNALINETAKNILSVYENENGINKVEDWEVDQLLDWTNGLSFNDYVQNWQTIGTTANSDKLVVERYKLNNSLPLEREETYGSDAQSLNYQSASRNREALTPTRRQTSPIHK